MESMESLLVHTDEIWKLAYARCGNTADADDLTQETYLAALVAIRRGKEIRHPRTWLANTLMHIWNSRLRERYRMVTVQITDGMPEPAEEDDTGWIEPAEEVTLRTHIASLTKLYRDVIVMHYIGGLSVEQIAGRLGIPAGTVKRRLHDGREKIRKEKEKMETREMERITPMQVGLSFSGSYPGEDIMNLADGNLMQQILATAYEVPLKQEEIAEKLQIPLYYFEDLLEKAADCELMGKNEQGKYYTNAYIRYVDREPALWKDTMKLTEEHLDVFADALEKLEGAVDALSVSRPMNHRQLAKLKRFAFLELLHRAKGRITDMAGKQPPVRRDGGRWYLLGYVTPLGWETDVEIDELAGHRTSGGWNENAKASAFLHEFDTAIWDNGTRYICRDWLWCQVKLLHAVYKEEDPLTYGVPAEMVEAFPKLMETGLYADENGRRVIDIPVLTDAEYNALQSVVTTQAEGLAKQCGEFLESFAEAHQSGIPAHLPDMKEYWKKGHALWHLESAVCRILYEKGIHLKGVDFCCPPAVFVIEE